MMSLSDTIFFLQSLLLNPRRVAAVAPSSAHLAEIMTREIGSDIGRVLELGPGTGVFTRALLARGIDETDLTLIERGQDFALILKQRFPFADIIPMDAADLARCGLFGCSHFGAVVSGLPLLSMSQHAVTAIFGAVFDILTPDGSFYQFTYGPRCPIKLPILERLGLTATRIGGTFWNLPPASVYRISRCPNRLHKLQIAA